MEKYFYLEWLKKKKKPETHWVEDRGVRYILCYRI